MSHIYAVKGGKSKQRTRATATAWSGSMLGKPKERQGGRTAGGCLYEAAWNTQLVAFINSINRKSTEGHMGHDILSDVTTIIKI